MTADILKVDFQSRHEQEADQAELDHRFASDRHDPNRGEEPLLEARCKVADNCRPEENPSEQLPDDHRDLQPARDLPEQHARPEHGCELQEKPDRLFVRQAPSG